MKAWFLSALAVLVASGSSSAIAQSGGGISMDITITRSVVDRDGQPVGLDATPRRYRVSRLRTDTGWRTTMAVKPDDGAKGAASNPLAGGRLEFDEAGSLLLFDSNGQAVTLPSSMRPAIGQGLNGDWSNWLTAARGDANSRRTRLEEVRQQYGREVGQVRGSLRFVRETGDVLEELLFDQATALPMQINVVQGGALKSQMTLQYAQEPGIGMVRRATRSEIVINPNGDRAIITTEVGHVVMGGK